MRNPTVLGKGGRCHTDKGKNTEPFKCEIKDEGAHIVLLFYLQVQQPKTKQTTETPNLKDLRLGRPLTPPCVNHNAIRHTTIDFFCFSLLFILWSVLVLNKIKIKQFGRYQYQFIFTICIFICRI